MYFHLLCSALRQRARGSEWHVFPDEKLGVSWQTLQDCVHAVGRRPSEPKRLFDGTALRIGSYSVRRLLEVRSHEEPLAQLADFFCGLGVFSRLKFSAYKAWTAGTAAQRPLFAQPAVIVSATDEQRFLVLQDFKHQADAAGLGVSLSSSRGLRTREPGRPLNFWWYEPQHPKDRAPVKARAGTR